jgi:uncharacterized membrane protein
MDGWGLIGNAHHAMALLALASGALVLLSKKGGRRHRRTGWVYVASMAAVNLTAFLIYDLFNRIGPFHIAAMVSAITVLIGVVPAVRRRPNRSWVEHHAHWMAWSYIGLVAAAVSEVSTRYLDMPFSATVLVATAIVLIAGGLLVWMRLPATLKPFLHRSALSIVVMTLSQA